MNRVNRSKKAPIKALFFIGWKRVRSKRPCKKIMVKAEKILTTSFLNRYDQKNVYSIKKRKIIIMTINRFLKKIKKSKILLGIASIPAGIIVDAIGMEETPSENPKEIALITNNQHPKISSILQLEPDLINIIFDDKDLSILSRVSKSFMLITEHLFQLRSDIKDPLHLNFAESVGQPFKHSYYLRNEMTQYINPFLDAHHFFPSIKFNLKNLIKFQRYCHNFDFIFEKILVCLFHFHSNKKNDNPINPRDFWKILSEKEYEKDPLALEIRLALATSDLKRIQVERAIPLLNIIDLVKYLIDPDTKQIRNIFYFYLQNCSPSLQYCIGLYCHNNKVTDIAKQYFELASSFGHKKAEEISLNYPNNKTKDQIINDYGHYEPFFNFKRCYPNDSNDITPLKKLEYNVDNNKNFDPNLRLKLLYVKDRFNPAYDRFDKDFIGNAIDHCLLADRLNENQNSDRAIHHWEIAAHQGNIHAQYKLGYIFRALEKDLTTYKIYYQQAADGEHPTAQYYAAHLYSMEKDIENFDKYIKLAVDQGNDSALLKISQNYHCKGNLIEAKSYCEKAVRQKNPFAALHYGDILISENNYDGAKKAYTLVIKYAFHNMNTLISQAHNGLGKLFEREGNIPSAKKHYGLSILANANNLESATALSNIDLREKYFEDAKKCLLGWVNKEVPIALYYRGCIHEAEGSYENAFLLYQKAAVQNIQSAILNMGYLYERGLGVEKNIEKANECYQRGKSRLADWKERRGLV